MIKSPISQHWINWYDQTLEMFIAIAWVPEGEGQKGIAAWRAGQESWRICDFIAWCVKHKEKIDALRKEEGAKCSLPEGLCGVPSGPGSGVGIPVVSEGGVRKDKGHRLGLFP